MCTYRHTNMEIYLDVYLSANFLTDVIYTEESGQMYKNVEMHTDPNE